MARLTEQEFLNFWKYYKDEPHQREAVGIMYGQMHAGLLDDEHAWVKQYRTPSKPLGGQNPKLPDGSRRGPVVQSRKENNRTTFPRRPHD